MERVWAWLWARHGPRYGWAVAAFSLVVVLPIWMTSGVLVVAFEQADRYELPVALACAVGAVWVVLVIRPAGAPWRLVHRWAAGEPVDPEQVLGSTYAFARGAVVMGVLSGAALGAGIGAIQAALVDAGTSRAIQWAVCGFASFAAIQIIAIHSFAEAFLRPVRLAVIADSGIGDSLPRARPSLAAWANVATLGTVWIFTFVGAAVSGALADDGDLAPIVLFLVATGATLVFGAPITVANAFAPMLRPVRDLGEGTARVVAGDYTRPVPAVQDDDLGVLVASFNRMQAGLAERQRLQAAFGSYVDPALATRLLEQGDDVFTGERRVVSVMFVDVRDFTPYAESHTAEETVALLSSLFELIVPTVIDAGGHVNKYLGDGALAVFGAPNDLADHADAAVAAAVEVERLVAERFGGEVRIGVGINTGEVIAGTIGGGGKLEFTLIGDTVNVAARVEQLTKATGDTILLTDQTLAALQAPPAGLVDRGPHELKGKAGATRVYAL